MDGKFKVPKLGPEFPVLDINTNPFYTRKSIFYHIYILLLNVIYPNGKFINLISLSSIYYNAFKIHFLSVCNYLLNIFKE